MDSNSLNVVYIGSPSFPIGGATTKRRRYMVDYMNAKGISCHYLCCDFKQRGKRYNETKGMYGNCDYVDITPFAKTNIFFPLWKSGIELLKEWYDNDAKNILIFTTILYWYEYPFFYSAKKMGYIVIFDQVETSFSLAGKFSLQHRINIKLSEYISHKAYKNSEAFVISSLLEKENREKYPQRKICLLPNSTPILSNHPIEQIHNPLRLLYSGTYGEKEGVKYLVDGVIKAQKKGYACELYLTGKGTGEEMTYINSISAQEGIFYLGYVDDEELKQRLLNSDVLCMVRTNTKFANYGFPFKLSEYLATGRIVLATNVGDVEKYIKRDKDAFIIEPENSDAVAETIIRIINNPHEAITIAASGHKVMKDIFSVNRVGQIFEDFLHSL